jgi:hypothetical protein
MQARALQRASVKVAIHLPAITALANLDALRTVGFSWTRTPHRLRDRLVQNPHTTIKVEGLCTDSRGATTGQNLVPLEQKML